MSADDAKAGAHSGEPRGAWGRAGLLGAGVILVAALVGMANFLGHKYHARFDWTKTQFYSLSEKTANVLAGLDRDVEVVVFLMPGDALYDPTREILARYEAASPRIRVRFLDSARNPLEAQQLAEKYDVDSASVVFVAGDDRKVVSSTDLADLDFSAMQMGGQAEVRAFKGEQQFTGALVQLSSATRPTVRFTTGHGERTLDDLGPTGLSQLARLLKGDNFEVEEWASMKAPSVPEGTSLVVVAGPRSTFLPPELDALTRYLDAGGRILLLLDPVVASGGSPELIEIGLEPWLAGWGVKVGRDVVVDPANPLPFFGPETIFLSDVSSHPATRSIAEGGLAVLVSLTRSVSSGDAPAEFRATELIRTSDQGWGETDLSDPQLSDGDLRGPVPLAVVVEKSGANPADEFDEEGGTPPAAASDEAGPTARLAVVGDSDFVSDQLLQANAANGALASNLVAWLTERQNLLGIPAKEPERVRLALTQAQVRWVYALVLLVLPALAVVGGVAVHFRRRR